MRTQPVVALLLGCAFAGSAFAQQGPRKFGWLPANDETARLDPANYYGGRTYNPSPGGGNMHVDIKSQKAVTIFMARASDWSYALTHPEAMATLNQVCARTHVTETTYTCFISEPMTLVIEDERQSTSKAVFAGLGAALDTNTNNAAANNATRVASVGLAALLGGGSTAKKHFTDPNDVHVQYYRWDCVENCVQPEFEWTRVVKEKYKLTTFPKVYGGYTPDTDGEQISVFIKSPVPMTVAVLPSSVADQVYSNPQTLDSALQKNACQQRGVQKLQFQCTFNAGDGLQSLVVLPEDDSRVPHKNAEVVWLADKCVANCPAPQPPPPASAQPPTPNQPH